MDLRRIWPKLLVYACYTFAFGLVLFPFPYMTRAFGSFFTLFPGHVKYCDQLPVRCSENNDYLVKTSNFMKSVVPPAHQFLYKSNDVLPTHATVGQDKIQPSRHNISVLKHSCKLLCTSKYVVNDIITDMKRFDHHKGLILNKNNSFIVDNKLIPWCYGTKDKHHCCANGIPIGCYVPALNHTTSNFCANILGVSPQSLKRDTYYMFNHFDFTIVYNSVDRDKSSSAYSMNTRVGSIEVVKFTPKSVKHEDPNMVSGCDSSRKFLEFSAKSVTNEIVMTYSYSVQVLINKHFTVMENIYYFLLSVDQKQWIRFLSLILFNFILMYVASLFLNMECFDILKSNRWTLAGLDKKAVMILSVHFGTLIQSLFILIIFLGSRSLIDIPLTKQRSLLACLLIICHMHGAPAGYISSKMYTSAGGDHWEINAVLTSMYCPILTYSAVLFENHFHGSDSFFVSEVTLLGIILLWLSVSIPFTIIGALIGINKKSIGYELIDETNTIPEKPTCIMIQINT